MGEWKQNGLVKGEQMIYGLINGELLLYSFVKGELLLFWMCFLVDVPVFDGMEVSVLCCSVVTQHLMK